MGFIDLSNPSFEVKISEEVTYKLSAFGMLQWSKYCKYIQYKPYFDLVEDKEFGLPITDEKINEVYIACSEKVMQIDSPEISESLSGKNSLENIAYVFYLAAKRFHKEIKLEDIASAITFKHQAIIGKLVNDILALDTDDEVKNRKTSSQKK